MADDRPGEPASTGPDAPGSSRWRYDSFLLRLWHSPGGDRLHRVEVQHLQTGLVETAIDETPDWMIDTILESLDGGEDEEI
jgi:hypothetical protein